MTAEKPKQPEAKQQPIVKKRKKWRKRDWFDLILILICIPILIIGLAVSLSIYQTKQNGGVSTVLGFCFFTVQTGSMDPELKVGESFVCNTKVSPKDIKQGDIISFYQGKRIITHKVYAAVSKTQNGQTKYYYVTYGVNNKDSSGEYKLDDFVVSQDQLIGVYVGTTKLNNFIDFLTSKWGMFCFVILPLGVLIITDILSLLSYIKPKARVGRYPRNPITLRRRPKE